MINHYCRVIDFNSLGYATHKIKVAADNPTLCQFPRDEVRVAHGMHVGSQDITEHKAEHKSTESIDESGQKSLACSEQASYTRVSPLAAE